MPCRVELSEAELEAARQARSSREIAKALKPVQDRNDELTHENDQLREVLLFLVEEYSLHDRVDPGILKQIEQDQVKHRKEDLRRPEKTILGKIAEAAVDQKIGDSSTRAENTLGWSSLLLKVREANPNLPLGPQLGFDPDEY